MLKRPLTRRYAPTSPRKRGEVNLHKLLRKKIAQTFLSPDTQCAQEARSYQVFVANRNFFPGRPCLWGGSAERRRCVASSKAEAGVGVYTHGLIVAHPHPTGLRHSRCEASASY
jgi:hypothetical protein